MVTVIVILGAAKMGEALISGLLRTGHSPTDLKAVVQRSEDATRLSEKYGIVPATAVEAVRSAATLVVTIDAWDIDLLLEEVSPYVGRDHLIISLAACGTTSVIEQHLGSDLPIVRVISNESAQANEVISIISVGKHANKEHLRRADEIMRSVGKVLCVPESQMSAAAAVWESGSAYVYFLAEVMADAGILLGLPPTTAIEAAIQTVYGAATLLRDSDQHPQDLLNAVASPGGTTVAALRELELHNVKAAFLTAVLAAQGAR